MTEQGRAAPIGVMQVIRRYLYGGGWICLDTLGFKAILLNFGGTMYVGGMSLVTRLYNRSKETSFLILFPLVSVLSTCQGTCLLVGLPERMPSRLQPRQCKPR